MDFNDGAPVTQVKETLRMTKKGKQSSVPEFKASLPKEELEKLQGPSTRNELMLKAKDAGIKNFRVLNKQELIDVKIIAEAVARWKSGWGKSSRVAGKDHKE